MNFIKKIKIVRNKHFWLLNTLFMAVQKTYRRIEL